MDIYEDPTRLPGPDPDQDSEDVTALLHDLGTDGVEISADLVDRVYRELKQLASYQLRYERQDHTLQPTALVNEAYIRLQGLEKWSGRAHFLRVASKVMRQILVDYARLRNAKKRGGENLIMQMRDGLPEPMAYNGRSADDVIAVDQALSQLARQDPRAAAIVELRFFGGLGEKDVCEILAIAPRTARRDWEAARTILYGQLKRKKDKNPEQDKDRRKDRKAEPKDSAPDRPTL